VGGRLFGYFLSTYSSVEAKCLDGEETAVKGRFLYLVERRRWQPLMLTCVSSVNVFTAAKADAGPEGEQAVKDINEAR
jgi:hypothetical protein